MNRDDPRLPGYILVGAGVLGAGLGFVIPQLATVGLAVALVSMFYGATLVGPAGRLAHALRPFVRSRVRVHVWGAPLPGDDAAGLELESVRALGVGLILSLRPVGGGRATVLKVARPRSALLVGERLEIGDARSVSWGGRRLARSAAEGASALVLVHGSDRRTA